MSSLVQLTVTGRLGSEVTLQSRWTVEPRMADWCSGALIIRVGSEVEAGEGEHTHTVTHTCYMNSLIERHPGEE